MVSRTSNPPQIITSITRRGTRNSNSSSSDKVSKTRKKEIEQQVQNELDSLPEVFVIIPVFKSDEEMIRYYSRLPSSPKKTILTTRSGRRIQGV